MLGDGWRRDTPEKRGKLKACPTLGCAGRLPDPNDPLYERRSRLGDSGVGS
jgi:hypothetical protein